MSPKPGRHSCLINSLPNEILAVIFMFVRNTCIEGDAERGVPGWVLSLTHICSRWRAVALSTQLLWTLVPRHISLAWQQAFVERSGNSPLGLSLHFPFSANSLPAREMIHRTAISCLMVQKNLWRLTALWLLFDALDFYPGSWSQFLGLPAPELRAFRMDAADPQAVELPRDLFQGHAPNLDCIQLDNIYFTWPSLAFPELIVLKIDHSEGLSDTREGGMGTFPELLSLLSALPKLQWLELHGFIYTPSNDRSPVEAVSLPQMKIVKLFGIGEILLLLLNYLNLPSTTNTFLKLSSTVSFPHETTVYLSRYLKSHFHAPQTMTMKLTANEFCFELLMEPETYLGKYGSIVSPPLTVEYARLESLPIRLFFEMAMIIVQEGLTFSHLTSLHIESDSLHEHTSTIWVPILLRASALEYLGLKGPALPELCIMLCRPLGESTIGGVVDGERAPILPSLQRLSLWDVSFDSLVVEATQDLEKLYWYFDRAFARDPDTLSDPEEQEDVLGWIWNDTRFKWISALRERAGMWKPLEKITLEECSGLPDQHWVEYLFCEAACSPSTYP